MGLIIVATLIFIVLIGALAPFFKEENDKINKEIEEEEKRGR